MNRMTIREVRESTEIEDTRTGYKANEDKYDSWECWTLRGETNTVPYFTLYRGNSRAKYRYLVTNYNNHKFIAMNHDEATYFVECMQNNPFIVRHRTPGKLFGELGEHIVKDW